MTMIRYEEAPEFQGDLKKLLRRFRSLEQDLTLAKKTTIELFHVHKINNLAVFPMPNFCSEKIMVCKIKKFACHALKGRGAKSGIRVIYAFYPQEERVVFLEIYFKSDKEMEDRDRIKKYLKSLFIL